MERAVITVDGYVQGVGFRWWVTSVARELGLTGRAENLLDGRVKVDAQGESEALGKLIRALTEQPTRTGRPGRVTGHDIEWVSAESSRKGFSAY